MSVMYYNRQGEPISDTLEWAQLFEQTDYKRVALDEVDGFRISTVWLGLDHSFLPNSKPLIFETMVFHGPESDLYCERYRTEEEALDGHAKVVEMVKNGEIEDHHV